MAGMRAGVARVRARGGWSWSAGYVEWLEARADNDGSKIDDVAMKAIRRGWYLGEESFKDRLLKLAENPVRRSTAKSHSGAAVRETGLAEAVRLC